MLFEIALESGPYAMERAHHISKATLSYSTGLFKPKCHQKPYVKIRVELSGGRWPNMQRSYCPKTVLGTMIFQRSALEAELFRSGAAARKYNAYAAKALCKNTGGALGGHMAEHANIMLFKNGFWAL